MSPRGEVGQVGWREGLWGGLLSAMVLAQDPARFTQDVFSVSFAGTMMVPSYQHQGPGKIYLGIPVFVRLLRVTSPDEFLPTLKVKHTQ